MARRAAAPSFPPFTPDELTAIFDQIDLKAFQAMLDALPQDKVRWLAARLEPPPYLCKPACRPPEWKTDDDETSETFGFLVVEDGYQPCPYATGSTPHGLDNTRWMLIVKRAYGDEYTGHEKEPPQSPPVLTDKARMNVMVARFDAGFRLQRDDDPWLPGNAPQHLAVQCDAVKSNEVLTFADQRNRRLLEEATREARLAMEGCDDDLEDLDAEEEADRMAFVMARWKARQRQREKGETS